MDKELLRRKRKREKRMSDKGGKIRFAEELFKRETQPLLDLTIRKCYENAYPEQAKGSSKETLSVEASKLMKDPKVILKLEELREPLEDVFKGYAKKSFKELERIKKLAEKQEKIELNNMIKAEELKGKIAQIYVDKTENTNTNANVEITDEKVVADIIKKLDNV
jgi:hypothetical protein